MDPPPLNDDARSESASERWPKTCCAPHIIIAGAAVVWPQGLVAGVEELLVVKCSVEGVPAESPEDAMTRAKVG